MNQCIRFTNSLVEFSKYRPVVEVKLAIVGIFSILGNIRSVSENCFIKSLIFWFDIFKTWVILNLKGLE